MRIHIESLHITTIIGLLNFERITAQRVIVDLEAEYLYKNSEFINYATLTELITKQLQTQKYELLEEALLGLEDTITTTYPKINQLKLKILKPDILDNCTVGLSCEWNKK